MKTPPNIIPLRQRIETALRLGFLAYVGSSLLASLNAFTNWGAPPGDILKMGWLAGLGVAIFLFLFGPLIYPKIYQR